MALLIAALTALAAPPLLLVAQAGPAKAGAPVLVVAGPGVDVEALVAAAGGRVIAPRSAPMATLAVFQKHGFAARLSQRGAWLVRDGAAMAAICGVSV